MDVEIMDRVGSLVKDRPDFGVKQVKNKKEIKKGRTYLRHAYGPGRFYCLSFVESILCLDKPFKKEDGSWWFWGCHVKKGNEWYSKVYRGRVGIGKVEIISLANCGVTPHSNGMWNPTSWLEKVREKKKKKLIKRMNTRHPLAGKGL